MFYLAIYLQLYGIAQYFPSSQCSVTGVTGRKEMFYFTMHKTHFICGYMSSYIWLRTTQIEREETRCRPIGYSFRLAVRVILYASSHRQNITYPSLCYTSRGALAGTRNWYNRGHGMCYPICGIMHIKEPLMLFRKISQCGGSRFPLLAI